jgi:hypothetical protein
VALFQAAPVAVDDVHVQLVLGSPSITLERFLVRKRDQVAILSGTIDRYTSALTGEVNVHAAPSDEKPRGTANAASRLPAHPAGPSIGALRGSGVVSGSWFQPLLRDGGLTRR